MVWRGWFGGVVVWRRVVWRGSGLEEGGLEG